MNIIVATDAFIFSQTVFTHLAMSCFMKIHFLVLLLPLHHHQFKKLFLFLLGLYQLTLSLTGLPHHFPQSAQAYNNSLCLMSIMLRRL